MDDLRESFVLRFSEPSKYMLLTYSRNLPDIQRKGKCDLVEKLHGNEIEESEVVRRPS